MHQNVDLLGGPKAWKTFVFLVFSYEMVPRRGTKNGAGNEPEMEPEWGQIGTIQNLITVRSKPNHGRQKPNHGLAKPNHGRPKPNHGLAKPNHD